MSTERPLIAVPERGYQNLAKDEAAHLTSSQEFWELSEAGVLSLQMLPKGRARLLAGPYVGKARVGGVDLEVREKVPGALQTLLHYAYGPAFKIRHVPGVRTELGELIALLIRAFLERVSAYLSAGRDFEYRRDLAASPLLGGALDLRATARLRARGLGHQFAFLRTRVSYDLERNLIVRAALSEIGSIAASVVVDDKLLTQSRVLLMYFSDLLEQLAPNRAQASLLAEAAAERSDDDMLALAALILRHESFEHTDWTRGTTPRTWFLNLETLFEDGVRREIQRLGYAGISASKGSAHATSIYLGGSADFADPDLALWRERDCVGIGDVKYKEWSVTPGRSDLYQLMVHSAAFRSETAFLVYPGTTFAARIHGDAVTGAAVYSFRLGLDGLSGDVARMLRILDGVEAAAG